MSRKEVESLIGRLRRVGYPKSKEEQEEELKKRRKQQATNRAELRQRLKGRYIR